MSEEINYGYEDDNQESVGGLNFGLNSGVSHLVKFEFNPNGGKEGAAQEALDIVFNIDGRNVSYRLFPVTRAYDKQNQEVTDINHPAMKQAFKEFNATIVHILSAFVSKDTIKTAFSSPIAGFEEFCNIATRVLPDNYSEVLLDLFGQWQWQITGDNSRTYTRIPSPKHIKYGKWICKHIPPTGGEWKVTRLNGALQYKDQAGNSHPFKRNKWFMDSNFANPQTDEPIIPEAASNAASASNAEWE